MESSYFPTLSYEPWSSARSHTIFTCFSRTMAILHSSPKVDSKQLYSDFHEYQKPWEAEIIYWYRVSKKSVPISTTFYGQIKKIQGVPAHKHFNLALASTVEGICWSCPLISLQFTSGDCLRVRKLRSSKWNQSKGKAPEGHVMHSSWWWAQDQTRTSWK